MILPSRDRFPSAVLAGLLLWGKPVVGDEPLRFSGQTGPSVVQVVANLDDDDQDGQPDGSDDVINGLTDEADLSPLTITSADPLIEVIRLQLDTAAVRCFARNDQAWRLLEPDAEVVLRDGEAELLLECRSFASAAPGWNGHAVLAAVGLGAAGEPRARTAIEVRVAPVELVDETRRVNEVYVARGRYDNETFITELAAVLAGLNVPLTLHDATTWQEMWMQDTMELAVTKVDASAQQPARRMTVVLSGLRGVDPFPQSLLGPDVAVAQIALPRKLSGGDAWADWYGNLMASPPTRQWPHGRVIAGRNTSTGTGFHPDALDFLESQQAQSPIWIDTSWLLIKHVDEILAFLPGPDGSGVLLAPDPLAGLKLAEAAELPVATGSTAKPLAEANRLVAALIDDILLGSDTFARAGGVTPGQANGLLELLGWDEERVVRLPVAFAPPQGWVPGQALTNAEALWSNPINMLCVDGTVICGATNMPEAVMKVCREQFARGGAARVVFIDDACYHRAKGNIHCGTNARRE
jgi:hypothetical protein